MGIGSVDANFKNACRLAECCLDLGQGFSLIYALLVARINYELFCTLQCFVRSSVTMAFLVSTKLLALYELTLGFISVICPRWTAINVFNLSPARVNPIATRIGGSRDLVTGIGLLLCMQETRLRKLLVRGAALIYIIDAGSMAATFYEGNLERDTAFAGGLASVIVAMLALFSAV